MINKETDKKDMNKDKDKGSIDTARMDVQCHILIKDKDSKEVIVNKRG
jgi:hypothetical protein